MLYFVYLKHKVSWLFFGCTTKQREGEKSTLSKLDKIDKYFPNMIERINMIMIMKFMAM